MRKFQIQHSHERTYPTDRQASPSSCVFGGVGCRSVKVNANVNKSEKLLLQQDYCLAYMTSGKPPVDRVRIPPYANLYTYILERLYTHLTILTVFSLKSDSDVNKFDLQKKQVVSRANTNLLRACFEFAVINCCC